MHTVDLLNLELHLGVLLLLLFPLPCPKKFQISLDIVVHLTWSVSPCGRVRRNVPVLSADGCG